MNKENTITELLERLNIEIQNPKDSVHKIVLQTTIDNINKAESKSSFFIPKYNQCKSNLLKRFRNSLIERRKHVLSFVYLLAIMN